MPAKSKAQREAMAIAEHHPSELYERNKGLAKMSHSQLHDFASTKGLKAEHVHQVLHHNSKAANTKGPHVKDRF